MYTLIHLKQIPEHWQTSLNLSEGKRGEREEGEKAQGSSGLKNNGTLQIGMIDLLTTQGSGFSGCMNMG